MSASNQQQQQPTGRIFQRSYTETQLSKCHAQTAKDKFGPNAQDAIEAREQFPGFNTGPTSQTLLWPATVSQSAEDAFFEDDITFTVPSCARLRGNLTALSNSYNLYFAAYQDHIFVYRLRSAAAATLPKHPDAKIKCEPTREGFTMRGHVDRQLGGRSLNHIITGFLGADEILLACSDKGDVFAYYIKVLADKVFDPPRRVTNPADCPRHFPPFFEANVGKSAWGLAIHKRSRLMAVSSNRWEITVFAPAQHEPPIPPKKRVDKMSEVEKVVRSRRVTTRIIIGFPMRSHNMPNICFLDDEQGLAEKVAGTDINGHIWIADIWKAKTPIRRVLRNCAYSLSSDEFQGNRSHGWGVMAFQDHHFMKVTTLDEMLGVPQMPDGRITNEIRDLLGRPYPHADEIDDRRARQIQLFGRDAASCFCKDLRGLLDFVPDNPCRPSDLAHEHPPGDYWPDDPDEQAFYLASDFPIEPSAPVAQHWNDPVLQPSPSTLAAWEAVNASPEASSVGSDATQPDTDDAHTDAQAPSQSTQSTLAFPMPINMPNLDSSDLPPDPVVTIVQQMSSESYGSGPGLQMLEEILNVPAGNLGVQALHAIEKWKNDKRRLPPLIPRKSDDNIYYPHLGTIEPHTKKTTAWNVKRNEIPHNTFENWKNDDMASSYIFLRTYEKDIEFVQPTSKHARNWEMNPYFSSVLHCKNHDILATTDLFFGTSRINMLFHIPELCVVVLGSATGRVIVATLTKLEKPQIDATGMSLWNRGMRIEWILPREKEDREHRPLLKARPLHGLAVARVPETAGDATTPGRWRIMLHYQNHLMLSYEITRKEQTGKLCLF